jgi:hypothetical protein
MKVLVLNLGESGKDLGQALFMLNCITIKQHIVPGGYMTLHRNLGDLALLLVLAFSAKAAGPEAFFGNWNQRLEKSGGTFETAATSASVSIKPVGEGRVSVVMTEQVKGGKPTSEEYVFSLDGTPIKTEGAANVVRSWQQLGPTVWEWARKGSDHETTGHYVVSKDGRMLTITGQRQRASGARVYYQRVFEKQ